MSREEDLVARAREGDRPSLEALIATVKDLVYNLAVRMLGSPAEAEDATQEILIRLVTNLDSFRGESSFRTWTYRVAANHLLKVRRGAAESRFGSYQELADYLAEGIADDRPPLEDQLLVQEAKLRCTSAMLTILDRDERLAFILGEVLDLSSEDAAAVLEVTPEAFRKRLSRSRARMAEFTRKTCGLVNPDAPCRCARQAAHAAAKGYLSRGQLGWANRPVLEGRPGPVAEVDELTRAVAVMRSHPSYAAPEKVVEGLKALLVKGQTTLLG